MHAALKATRGDGYALGYVSNTVAVLTAVTANLPFDPVEDVKLITVMAGFSGVLAANASLPVEDFRAFIDYVRARPARFFYASYGAA